MDKTIDEDLKAEIIEDLGLKDLTSIEQDSIISDLEEKIIEQVNSIILDRLNDEEKGELETLLEDEEVSDFLRRTIPDLEEVKKQAAIWVVNSWKEEFSRKRQEV